MEAVELSRPQRLFRRVFRYVMLNKGFFLGATALTVVSSLLGLVSPILSGTVIDRVVAGNVSDIWIFALAIVCLTVFSSLIHFGSDILGELLAQKVVYRLRTEIFEHLQNLSYSFYDKVDAGQIITRVTSDMDQIGRLLGFALPNLVNAFCLLASVSAVLLFQNRSLALIAFSITPFIAGISLMFNRVVRPFMQRVWVEVSKVNAMVQEVVAGFRIVKALGMRGEMVERFESRNKELYDIGIKTTKLSSVAWPSLGLVMGVGTAAIYWYGGLQAIGNETSLGERVAFTMYLGMMTWPIMSIGFILTRYQRAMVSAQRIFEVMDTEPEVKESPGAVELPNPVGRVRFENVTFGYDKDKPVLKGLNLEVSPGEKVAILGATGSGKSTLIKLIPRFYDPQEGRVLVGNYDVRGVKIESLRKWIGIVHQDIFLFPLSIRENIAYGKPNATQEEIESVAKTARIHDFIASLPQGYDTLVGERGITLSGGQRQRVAIARSLLVNPSILILDDSTSSVDADTEREIYEALRELVKNRTVFIVTQRLSTLKLADRIVVIEGGKVVEDGKHEELLKKSGAYARLYMAQFARQEADG
ncbi:MAG: ABC transporter ATP-binding protein [Candidatus Brockarchaeota archaeon]|nr:ABC transporter ATP-binding protein [Candidatus Brockarchaeota archaeon]